MIYQKISLSPYLPPDFEWGHSCLSHSPLLGAPDAGSFAGKGIGGRQPGAGQGNKKKVVKKSDRAQMDDAYLAGPVTALDEVAA